MLDDMLKIVMDPLFGSQGLKDKSFTYSVEGYEDGISMWKLIQSWRDSNQIDPRVQGNKIEMSFQMKRYKIIKKKRNLN